MLKKGEQGRVSARPIVDGPELTVRKNKLLPASAVAVPNWLGLSPLPIGNRFAVNMEKPETGGTLDSLEWAVSDR